MADPLDLYEAAQLHLSNQNPRPDNITPDDWDRQLKTGAREIVDSGWRPKDSVVSTPKPQSWHDAARQLITHLGGLTDTTALALSGGGGGVASVEGLMKQRGMSRSEAQDYLDKTNAQDRQQFATTAPIIASNILGLKLMPGRGVLPFLGRTGLTTGTGAVAGELSGEGAPKGALQGAGAQTVSEVVGRSLETSAFINILKALRNDIGPKAKELMNVKNLGGTLLNLIYNGRNAEATTFGPLDTAVVRHLESIGPDIPMKTLSQLDRPKIIVVGQGQNQGVYPSAEQTASPGLFTPGNLNLPPQGPVPYQTYKPQEILDRIKDLYHNGDSEVASKVRDEMLAYVDPTFKRTTNLPPLVDEYKQALTNYRRTMDGVRFADDWWREDAKHWATTKAESAFQALIQGIGEKDSNGSPAPRYRDMPETFKAVFENGNDGLKSLFRQIPHLRGYVHPMKNLSVGTGMGSEGGGQNLIPTTTGRVQITNPQVRALAGAGAASVLGNVLP